MEIIKEITETSDMEQIKKLTFYCFNDTIGWTAKLFPLYNGDKCWGIFSDTQLCGCTFARNYQAVFYHSTVPMCGIACVASWPETRNKGLIKKLISAILKTEYNNGKLVSALYPFKFHFYEMFGYGFTGGAVRCTFNPVNLNLTGKPGGEWVQFAHTEKQLADIYAMLDEWIPKFNLGIFAPRYTLAQFTEYSQWLKENDYLYYADGVCKAYIRFKLSLTDEKQVQLSVKKAAWADSGSFLALLHFLFAHRDQCAEIEWFIPANLPILSLMHDPRIRMIPRNDYMTRPLNVLKIINLKLQHKPVNGKLSFSVQDPLLIENTGTYIIDGMDVKKENFRDINSIPFPVFSSLLFGRYSWAEAEFAGLIKPQSSGGAHQFFTKEDNIFLSENF